MFNKLPVSWRHKVAQLIRTPVALQFMRAARHPRAYQEKQLNTLLRANQHTAFGRQYGFQDIDNFDTYREKVPLMSPETLRPWVEKMQAGQTNMLTAEEPVFYGKSTGTTGTPKEIPINNTYRKDFQRSVFVSAWFYYRNVPEAFSHKLLYFVAQRCLSRTPNGLEVGYISGYNFTELPEQIRSIYAWPYEIVEVEDLESRLYLSLHIAIMEKVSLIAGIFPSNILLMFRALRRYADEMATHFEAGTLPEWLKLTDEQKAFFEAYKTKSPALAQRMKQVDKAPELEKVALALPYLRVIFCWKTSTAGMYIPELQERVGPHVKLRDTIYSATEGWCSIPLGEEEDGGPVALTSHVYEFIEEEIVDEHGADLEALSQVRTKLVDELEVSKRYYIILTTSAGLYRYFLGDLVEVSGFWRTLPKLQFVRKYGATYNLVGERLEETNVNIAIGQALQNVARRATWFAMVPTFDSTPYYQLFVEFTDEAISEEALQHFADEVHAQLEENTLYWEEFIHEGVLKRLKVRQVKTGSMAKQFARWESEGRSVGQLKLSHLVTDTEKLPCRPEEDIVCEVLAALIEEPQP